MNSENADKKVNEWIKKYSTPFFNYVYKRIPDKTSAKEILQETFIAAWKSCDNFKNKANEKTWLFAILKNKIVDHYRIQSRLKTNLPNSSNFFDDLDHWTVKASPVQWHEAAASLNRKEFYGVLEKCKNKLTTIQQVTFSMKYIDEYEADFICKVLKITASNYWVILHRTKLQLRSCLEKNWFNNNIKL